MRAQCSACRPRHHPVHSPPSYLTQTAWTQGQVLWALWAVGVVGAETSIRWRQVNPQQTLQQTPEITCWHRIDLLLRNDKVLPMIHTVEYLVCGISYHLSLLAKLTKCPMGRRPAGRIQSFWLPQIGSNHCIPHQQEMFLEAHESSQRDGLFWDAFKAYLRGVLKSTINNLIFKARYKTRGGTSWKMHSGREGIYIKNLPLRPILTFFSYM